MYFLGLTYFKLKHAITYYHSTADASVSVMLTNLPG